MVVPFLPWPLPKFEKWLTTNCTGYSVPLLVQCNHSRHRNWAWPLSCADMHADIILHQLWHKNTKPIIKAPPKTQVFMKLFESTSDHPGLLWLSGNLCTQKDSVHTQNRWEKKRLSWCSDPSMAQLIHREIQCTPDKLKLATTIQNGCRYTSCMSSAAYIFIPYLATYFSGNSLSPWLVWWQNIRQEDRKRIVERQIQTEIKVANEGTHYWYCNKKGNCTLTCNYITKDSQQAGNRKSENLLGCTFLLQLSSKNTTRNSLGAKALRSDKMAYEFCREVSIIPRNILSFLESLDKPLGQADSLRGRAEQCRCSLTQFVWVCISSVLIWEAS